MRMEVITLFYLIYLFIIFKLENKNIIKNKKNIYQTSIMRITFSVIMLSGVSFSKISNNSWNKCPLNVKKI